MAKRPSGKRVRRSREDGVAATLELAAKGPFTSKELASGVGFTANRARQLLEELRREKKLAMLGVRRSHRGKPSTLWGLPGTRITEDDKAARQPTASSGARSLPSATSEPRAVRRPRVATAAAASSTAATASVSGMGFLDRVWQALQTGIEIEDPDGRVFTVRLRQED